MNLEKFYELNHGEIFATGVVDNSKEGIEAFAFSPGDKLKWIAKVSNGDHSWAIYYHFADATNKIIKEYGIKVKDLETIKRLVPCTPEMLSKYRY